MSLKSFLNHFLLLSIITNLLNTVHSSPNNSNSISSIDQKVQKVKACNILSRVRTNADLEYIKYVATFADPNSSEEESVQRFLPLLMMTCMKSISEEYAAELSELEDANGINPLNSENKRLLDVERWENVFSSNDEKRISEEVAKYSNQMKDLRMVQEYMQNRGKKEENKEKSNLEYEMEDDFHNDNRGNNYDDSDYYDSRQSRTGRNDFDLNIFGFDISKLSDNYKYILGGILLLVLFGAFVIVSKNAISNLPSTKQKISNKKKKNN